MAKTLFILNDPPYGTERSYKRASSRWLALEEQIVRAAAALVRSWKSI